MRQFTTNYKIFPSEWDSKRGTVTNPTKKDRRKLVCSIRENIRCDIARLQRIVSRFDSETIPFSAEEVIQEFNRYSQEYLLKNYTECLIAKLQQSQRVRTAETYRSMLLSFMEYREEEDILLEHLSSGIVEGYEAWLKSRGLLLNSISYYMRILRAIYNRAVDDGAIENCKPFKRVYTGIAKTRKRALPLDAIKRFKELDLSKEPKLAHARDMFLMSFYLRGMSFVDMAYLKKSDLKDGYIRYQRRKTNQALIIEWTPEMQAITDRYQDEQSTYLLPIIRKHRGTERSAYKNANSKINRNLKLVAERLGIHFPVTHYMARHSWASIAQSEGIPLSVISEGMGHDNESTTRIYLSGIDTCEVDKANRKLLNSL